MNSDIYSFFLISEADVKHKSEGILMNGSSNPTPPQSMYDHGKRKIDVRNQSEIFVQFPKDDIRN